MKFDRDEWRTAVCSEPKGKRMKKSSVIQMGVLALLTIFAVASCKFDAKRERDAADDALGRVVMPAGPELSSRPKDSRHEFHQGAVNARGEIFLCVSKGYLRNSANASGRPRFWGGDCGASDNAWVRIHDAVPPGRTYLGYVNEGPSPRVGYGGTFYSLYWK